MAFNIFATAVSDIPLANLDANFTLIGAAAAVSTLYPTASTSITYGTAGTTHYLSGTGLAVAGAATVGTTLGVTGATTLSSTLAAGATTITGTLTSTGQVTVTGTSSIGGAATAYLGTSGTGLLLNTPTGQFGTLSSANNAVLQWQTGAVSVTGTLSVSGTSTMAAINTSGLITSTVGANLASFRNTSGASGYQYMELANTSGDTIWGTEGSTAGSILTGSSAYASVFAATVAKSLHLGTSNTVRLTIDSAGAVTIPGTLDVTGEVQQGGSVVHLLSSSTLAYELRGNGTGAETVYGNSTGVGKLGVGYLQGNDKSYVYSVAPTLVIGAGSVETVNVTSTGLSVTGTITGSSNLILNTAIAGENNINFTSNSLLRWQFTKIGSAETGSNAGADFAIYRYTDAGAFLGTPFAITRSTGAVTIGGNLTLGGTGIFEIPVNGYIVVPESGTPAPGGGNQARIFAVDNGAGKTILRVQFGSGAAQTIATEP